MSFLGLGFPADIPTWGRLLYDSKEYLDIAPHWALFPGTAIFLAVTIIGIPFAWAHLKLAGLALWPIGKDVVSV